MKAIFQNVYRFVMRTLRVMERRCGWCQKLLGWKPAVREMAGRTSHGICGPCQVKFEAGESVVTEQVIRRRILRQRVSRRTLRRRTGGWSGAVAA